METIFPFALALSVGFTHAFEADHLIAVSTIVTRHRTIWLALRDGVFWGLGHTSTILLVGSLFLIGQFALSEAVFHYLEAGVGLMLVGLGLVRLYRLLSQPRLVVAQPDGPGSVVYVEAHPHKLAYGVGLVHGLAGSGALILSVLTQIRGTGPGMVYLLLFGLGSMAGMMVAAGVFSLPFSARLTNSSGLRTTLTVVSAVVCIGLGTTVVYENLLN